MRVIYAVTGARPGFPRFKKPLGVCRRPCRSHRPLPIGGDLCAEVEEAAHDTRRSESSSLQSSPPRHRLWRRRTLHPCPSPRCIPKLKTNHVKYPQGWELTEPTL
ncbi:unnamed protein product [Musa hybrid cultivar]